MKVAVIGASGYVGAELIGLLCQHDNISIQHLLVSENSSSCGKTFAALHGRWQGICDLPLQSFSQTWFDTFIPAKQDKDADNALDAVFFATPHEFSALWAGAFLDAGIKVFDLSGGFRLKELADYPHYYGFEHQDINTLSQAHYGLAEWQHEQIAGAELVAVPGCYPTASLLALKPVIAHELQLENSLVVVNGISGVSGAGRTASLASNFNEVSLMPYNILKHRHQPEISQEAGVEVIFNPHLAPYKRGLLATVTLQLKPGVTCARVEHAFKSAYQDKALVRLLDAWPKIDNVAHSPFADLHWQYDEDKQVLVVACAIDNLLKGAAAQALQCANIAMGLPDHYGLLPQTFTGSGDDYSLVSHAPSTSL
ncbi:N-acetyl-gamma-glutamyl-phosphate reductase [Thalassomonas haliotis]|uniref:N-acetyl-gamma-glutamyl-phosphate reductase n=1 Tax=Thalassomonas haliotis TaxID=485448 RepID=A0ABY7VHG8_9GAMM|nr:N-acetyl-gamma-glutamyl-phosphate reductase [Thalassomonas haliotis]WDE12490.1 N-acetyl-gamma-glutamyl-phosphate reductase [Thalassomonas haliotis]